MGMSFLTMPSQRHDGRPRLIGAHAQRGII